MFVLILGRIELKMVMWMGVFEHTKYTQWMRGRNHVRNLGLLVTWPAPSLPVSVLGRDGVLAGSSRPRVSVEMEGTMVVAVEVRTWARCLLEVQRNMLMLAGPYRVLEPVDYHQLAQNSCRCRVHGSAVDGDAHMWDRLHPDEG